MLAFLASIALVAVIVCAYKFCMYGSAYYTSAATNQSSDMIILSGDELSVNYGEMAGSSRAARSIKKASDEVKPSSPITFRNLIWRRDEVEVRQK